LKSQVAKKNWEKSTPTTALKNQVAKKNVGKSLATKILFGGVTPSVYRTG